MNICIPTVIAALFTKAMTWKQSAYKENVAYTSTIEYYSSIKNNEILPFATIWMDLEDNTGEGNGTPLQYSCLENPMDGGAW